MKITKNWLKNKNACENGIIWFCNQDETDSIKIVKKLIKEKRLEWANWLITTLMQYDQYVAYAIYAAESVIYIFEKKYPENIAPRKAIEAAKLCLKSPTKKNKTVAAEAAWFVAAADVAAAAAALAALAAEAAARAAARAVDAAYAAAAAAAAAARADDAVDGYNKALLLILRFGLKLLKNKGE